MILEFTKVRKNARTPNRANPSDAGLDIFYCPENNEPVVLRTNENKILPTGLKFGVPHGYMLQVMNRSSMAARNNLVVGAHCIDSGYDGEVFIDLHNIGLVEKVIKPGEKIAQLVLVPVGIQRVLYMITSPSLSLIEERAHWAQQIVRPVGSAVPPMLMQEITTHPQLQNYQRRCAL
jgi:dUTP pyrophosphatase